MKLMGVTIGIAVLVGLIAAGCGRGTQNDASSQGMASMPAAAPPAAAAPPMTSMQDIAVTFKTEPDPPKVGENTFEAVQGQFECRSLGETELKGKAKKVTAYEVVSAASSLDVTPPGAASGGA